MNIFIRSLKLTKLPQSEIEYTAYQGFQALGFKPVFFESEDELQDTRPDDLIVAGVSIVTRKLQSFGIQLEDYDYPAELDQYLGRKVWRDSLSSILANKEKWPLFVKPVRDKVFTGFVLQNEKSIPRLYRASKNEPVYCSELVSFEAEWRVFVRYGNIIDVRPYKGDWHQHYDSDLIEQAVQEFRSAPAGYGIDFGITDKGETRLIEVNDGYSLGTYGLDPIEYAKLLSARWCELTCIHDECDQYLECVDWKAKKRL
ncbi:MAG: ATP-grasp domain-containing protein [Anaerovoracaceae bacterium]|jgi:hypothetical protein